jgi:hypothetical protein
VRDFHEFEKIEKNTLLWISEDGKWAIISPIEGYILFGKSKWYTSVNETEEVFFILSKDEGE